MDAAECTDCRSKQLLGDDLNSLKVAGSILNKCFQGQRGRRFVGGGHNSFVGARAHPAP